MTEDGEAKFLFTYHSFIIPTWIVVPATKNDIKVVLDQENVGNPCIKVFLDNWTIQDKNRLQIAAVISEIETFNQTNYSNLYY